MSVGSLAVVEAWLEAVNHGDVRALERLTHAEVEIAGPRGGGRMDRAVLAEWLARAGFSAEELRWFCGANGSVVVEQDARWVDAVSGARRGSARVASRFVVDDGRVASYARHDDGLQPALTAAGLGVADEVIERAV
jgi:SnoaL-like domain